KLITEQNLASLLQDLKKLKPHYQKVLHLRYFQELSYEEIAKELNEHLNNVKVKLLRAKRIMTEIIHQPKIRKINRIRNKDEHSYKSTVNKGNLNLISPEFRRESSRLLTTVFNRNFVYLHT